MKGGRWRINQNLRRQLVAHCFSFQCSRPFTIRISKILSKLSYKPSDSHLGFRGIHLLLSLHLKLTWFRKSLQVVDNQGMFSFGHSCSQAFIQSSRVTISSSLKLAPQPHKPKLYLIIPSHHGIRFESLICQTNKKTFYGEQPVMHYLYVQNQFRDASSTIQSALYSQFM